LEEERAEPGATAAALARDNGLPEARQLCLAHELLCYRRAGSGPPLLLLHGWGASARYWFGTLAAMADARTCYAIDLPGFGHSPPLASPPSLARLAELIVECADALDIARFDLNGHSFGGAVAAQLAARWPARVRKLVLTSFGTHPTALERALLEGARHPLGLAIRMWSPWLGVWRPWLDLWRPSATALLNGSLLPQLMAAWFIERQPADPQLLREGMADLLRMDLGAHLACIASVGDPALAEALGAIRAPTLLVGGRRDRATPPAALAAAHELLPNCRLAWLEECGHVPMIECPESYHQAVRDFLLRD